MRDTLYDSIMCVLYRIFSGTFSGVALHFTAFYSAQKIIALAFVVVTDICYIHKKENPGVCMAFQPYEPGGVNAFWARSVQKLWVIIAQY